MGFKISSAIILSLVASMFLLTIGNFGSELTKNYVDTGDIEGSGVNKSEFEMFNNQNELNETFYPYKKKFEDLDQEESSETGISSWFDKLGDTAIALPTLIVQLPGTIFSVFTIINSNISSALGIMMIGPAISGIVITIIILFVIFKLVEFWRRTPV